MTASPNLRSRAEGLAAALPPLMAEAEHLAATVILGAHGRRRAGMGDEFWQYRPAIPGDEQRRIDWRRSGRSDQHFIRQKEWQAAQSVMIWPDAALSMTFSSDRNLPSKGERARLLALATAILLVRAGERVGLSGEGPPRAGEVQLTRLVVALERTAAAPDDFGLPEITGLPGHSRALFLSDFLGDIDGLAARLTEAADRGIRGAIVQILDPQEEEFPFRGRTVFESMGRTIRHETLKAADLRARYLDRLAGRKEQLSALAASTGWLYRCHHTSETAQAALLWIHGALERRG